MSAGIFNKREKLSAPPFITVEVDEEIKRTVLKTLSKLRTTSVAEKSMTFSSEGDLLKAFIIRKGTQLRLEKALMLTRRILTLVVRWKCNSCWAEFCKFKDGFESDGGKKKKRGDKLKSKKTELVKGNMKGIRLPSRQWSNWVIYLTLRDLLLLSKIKYECERTVGYWLGMISCSHHPADSLVIVGILSRIWAVSSGMVEDYANHVYPSLCFISSQLATTKADNWLHDIDFPNDLFTWLEKILGFPFQRATIGGYEEIMQGQEGTSIGKMDRILGGVFGTSQEDKTPSRAGIPSTSSKIRDSSSNYEEEAEDVGVPVSLEGKGALKKKDGPGKKGMKKKGGKKVALSKKGTLDDRWTKFFKNFKTKLETEAGRKQLLTRIKKYKKTEANPDITLRLQKLFKFVKADKQDKVLVFIPKFKKFLKKRS